MPESERHLLTVTREESRRRLDRFLSARFPAHSRSYLQSLIHDGLVTREGVPLRASRAVAGGEQIEVVFPPPRPSGLVPEPAPLSILHEDDQLLVVDKPAGIAVHPGAGAREGTLVHRLMHHCRDLPAIGGVERPGIVHRLDKQTSGVLLVAKTDATHRSLVSQFQNRSIRKVYVALVWGKVAPRTGSVELAIGRDSMRRARISTRTARPRQASTSYVVKGEIPGFSWLEVMPLTGRTHQIRVHMQHLKHPVVGDEAYGGTARINQVADAAKRDALRGFKRLALHALRISIKHPGTGLPVTFEAPVPEEISSLLQALR